MSKTYKVITPEGKEISVEEYMKTEHYNQLLEKGISEFLTDKKQKELISLFSKHKES